ncbi:CDP-diacylglycerol-serine O-phosphatidyltransferase [Kwoniella shivajii]|uniref:CDP-diacylglycerol--serine O-phosphatidyltransferase n=1 Tax=Kwoniella shivajii TaxID=564305 RepID=A0ABZ1CWN3_9TREE|nr:CDP-diacylglycerol-serine O-phosphatidyltransferase [Kwoniella shivajii]
MSVSEEKKKALQAYKDDEGHFSLVRQFRLADLITIMNGVCGTLSILSSARYLIMSSNVRNVPSEAVSILYLAHLLPILGFGFDALDGKVARWMGGGSMLGQEMDSLADLVSFGVAPATLAFTLGLRTPLDTVALLWFVSCGLARLARFNATVALIPSDASGKSKYFEGLPIPSSLFLTSMMAFWVKRGYYVSGKVGGSDIPFGLFNKGSWAEVHGAAFIFAIWGAMMVSKTLRGSGGLDSKEREKDDSTF